MPSYFLDKRARRPANTQKTVDKIRTTLRELIYDARWAGARLEPEIAALEAALELVTARDLVYHARSGAIAQADALRQRLRLVDEIGFAAVGQLEDHEVERRLKELQDKRDDEFVDQVAEEMRARDEESPDD